MVAVIFAIHGQSPKHFGSDRPPRVAVVQNGLRYTLQTFGLRSLGQTLGRLAPAHAEMGPYTSCPWRHTNLHDNPRCVRLSIAAGCVWASARYQICPAVIQHADRNIACRFDGEDVALIRGKGQFLGVVEWEPLTFELIPELLQT